MRGALPFNSIDNCHLVLVLCYLVLVSSSWAIFFSFRKREGRVKSTGNNRGDMDDPSMSGPPTQVWTPRTPRRLRWGSRLRLVSSDGHEGRNHRIASGVSKGG